MMRDRGSLKVGRYGVIAALNSHRRWFGSDPGRV